jgi:hypothetical protein
MNLAQRVALLLALAVTLHVSATVIVFEHPRVLVGEDPRFGSLPQGAVFAAHVGAWLVAALYLLRDRGGAD